MAAVVADVGPLKRSRDFRLLFFGETVSFAGSTLSQVAIPYQIYQLTHSSVLVGTLSLCLFFPILAFGVYGGALADAVDRRVMVRLTELGLTVCAVLMVVNASQRHPRVWAIFVVGLVTISIDSLQRPSLDALIPRVVSSDDLSAALALNSLKSNIGSVFGPALAGVLIAASGVKLVYAVDVVSFLFSLVALWMMHAVPPPAGAERPSWARVAEGFRYARSRQDLIGTYAIDIAAMFFGMPEALFPQLSTHLGGPRALGLLFTAPAVGSLLVNLTSGWAGQVRRKGRVLVFAACGWGMGIVLLGISRNLWWALSGLVLAGGMDMVSGLMRSNIWNQTIPDSLRGRMAGIELVSYSSGPTLGNFESGAVESVAGLSFSVISGGVACVLSAVAVAVLLPGLWRFDALNSPGRRVDADGAQTL
jgi:MFS family permease